jgi:hypothetical protein
MASRAREAGLAGKAGTACAAVRATYARTVHQDVIAEAGDETEQQCGTSQQIVRILTYTSGDQ